MKEEESTRGSQRKKKTKKTRRGLIRRWKHIDGTSSGLKFDFHVTALILVKIWYALVLILGLCVQCSWTTDFPCNFRHFYVIWPSVLLGFERHVLNMFYILVPMFIIRAEPSLLLVSSFCFVRFLQLLYCCFLCVLWFLMMSCMSVYVFIVAAAVVVAYSSSLLWSLLLYLLHNCSFSACCNIFFLLLLVVLLILTDRGFIYYCYGFVLCYCFGCMCLL